MQNVTCGLTENDNTIGITVYPLDERPRLLVSFFFLAEYFFFVLTIVFKFSRGRRLHGEEPAGPKERSRGLRLTPRVRRTPRRAADDPRQI